MSKENGTNKLKLFVENMLVYGLGGTISKLIPLAMTFILTYLLPSRIYLSISDNTHLVQQFGVALAVMGMYDAMYRMFFEKNDEQYKKEICSTTMLFTLVTSIITVILMVIFKDFLAMKAYKTTDYSYLIYVAAAATMVTATNNIVAAPTRMQNKRKVFLVTNTLSPIISYAISIPLILKGYYLIALPLAAVIAGVTMEAAFLVMNHKWFSFKLFRFKHLKPLLNIALPLLPNFLIYWVYNSCDKLMITDYLGGDLNGLYSSSCRIGHCSQLIYTAFSGGWQFFAFSTMDEKDQVKNNSVIYEYLGAISFVATACVCSLLFYVFKLMDHKYIDGYIPAAYLFLAPLLLMLFQVACNQLIVVKKTWPNVLILSGGAAVNVGLNRLLIPNPAFGIEGAAIATLMGYIVTNVVVCIVLMKMKLMVLTPRFYAAAGVFAVFFVTWRFFYSSNVFIGLPAALIYTVFVCVLYKKDLNILIDKINSRKAKKANV